MVTNWSQTGHKNSRGTVSINNYKGRVRLRWSYQSKRYSERYELARKSDDTKKPQRRSRGGLCKAPPQGKSAKRSGADNSFNN